MQVLVTVPEEEFRQITSADIVREIAVQLIHAGAGMDAQKYVREFAQAQAKKWVEEALGEANVAALRFPKTNNYGEPTGKDRTFLEMVADTITTAMSARVDDQGYSGRGGNKMFAEYLIHKHTRELLEKTVRESVAAALPSVEGEIAKMISEAVTARLSGRR